MDVDEKLSILFRRLRQFRVDEDLEKFDKASEQVIETLKPLPETEQAKFLSRLFYERGFLLNNSAEDTKKYTESVQMFIKSADAAEASGDDLRKLIGKARASVTAYYGTLKDAKTAIAELKDQYEEFKSLNDVPPSDEALRENWNFSYLLHLAEIGFDVSEELFRKYAAEVLNTDKLNRGNDQPDPRMLLHRYRLEARINYIDGKHLECASTILTYIQYSDDRVPIDKSVERADEISVYIGKVSEKQSIENREAGRAILKTDLPEKTGIARAVWSAALDHTGKRGNLKYLNDIQEELKALDADQ